MNGLQNSIDLTPRMPFMDCFPNSLVCMLNPGLPIIIHHSATRLICPGYHIPARLVVNFVIGKLCLCSSLNMTDETI